MINENIKRELERQHISEKEFFDSLNISNEEKADMKNDTISVGLISRIAEYLGCTCDYLCGLSETGFPTEQEDKLIGFTCKTRTERLFNQLDVTQQWELYDIVSAYCFNHGITYSRLDGKAQRKQIINGILENIAKLGAV